MKFNKTEFNKRNQEERLKFVTLWANYVLQHDDKDWSRQQNRIINSSLRGSTITKEVYLKMKIELQSRIIGKKRKEECL